MTRPVSSAFEILEFRVGRLFLYQRRHGAGEESEDDTPAIANFAKTHQDIAASISTWRRFLAPLFRSRPRMGFSILK